MNKEYITKINECLLKIKEIEEKKMLRSDTIYDASVTNWCTVAQSILKELSALETLIK